MSNVRYKFELLLLHNIYFYHCCKSMVFFFLFEAIFTIYLTSFLITCNVVLTFKLCGIFDLWKVIRHDNDLFLNH